MFDPAYPLAAVRPAAYNPRRIDDAAFDRLRASVRTLGMVRPIIVTASGRLIAGHQRSRAMLAEGIDAAPAHVLADVSTEDEVRFNQLHNASDKEMADGADMRLALPCAPGWSTVDAAKGLAVARRPDLAAKLSEVLKLLARHGPFSGAVAAADGRIVAGHLYAFACKLLGRPLDVFALAPGAEARAVELLGREYGEFSYGHLPRTTWVQSLAQMYRIRKGREARTGKSRTYEEFVLPRIRPTTHALDFGAGQMDYVRHLRARRHRIIGVEFFRRRPGTMEIDHAAVQADIDRLCRRLRERGLFELVVCDSVLNSVDTLRAEADVLTTVNALCRPGGTIVISGRRRAFQDKNEFAMTYSRSTLNRHVNFTDADGFSAMYQRGVWLFQKFHTDAQARALAAATIGDAYDARLRGSGWAAAGVKAIERPDAEAALRREFDLPLPDGSSIGRADDVIAAWRTAVQLSADAQPYRKPLSSRSSLAR